MKSINLHIVTALVVAVVVSRSYAKECSPAGSFTIKGHLEHEGGKEMPAAVEFHLDKDGKISTPLKVNSKAGDTKLPGIFKTNAYLVDIEKHSLIESKVSTKLEDKGSFKSELQISNSKIGECTFGKDAAGCAKAAGTYIALTWRMDPADEGPAVLVWKMDRAGKLDPKMSVACL